MNYNSYLYWIKIPKQQRLPRSVPPLAVTVRGKHLITPNRTERPHWQEKNT